MRKVILAIFFIICFTSCVNANGLNLLYKKSFGVSKNILALMYHRISEKTDESNTYCISPKEFEKDIIYLKEKNYIFAFPDEIEKFLKLYPDKNIAMITFDDGYESDYKYALPVLEKHNAKATFFVIGSMIGDEYYLNEEQLKKLSASPCAKIGNHSYVLHKKGLDELISVFSEKKNSELILNDFKKNKDFLEEITNSSVEILSYPNSVYNLYIDSRLKNEKVCEISFSTEEKRFQTGKVIGRFNRSDKRSAEEIEKIHRAVSK